MWCIIRILFKEEGNMAIQKQLTAVTLQLEVSNGVDKNDQPKFKNISYEKLAKEATPEKLAEVGKEFGNLMQEAPKGMYVVERHALNEVA